MGRPDKVVRALFDASSLLGVVQGDPEFACLTTLLAAVDRGEVTLVESTSILAEVLPHHTRDTEAHALARRTMLELLESQDTELVDVSTVVARKAGQLKADLGLTTWDAMHLATAILAKVDVLIVRDHKFPEGDYEGVCVTGPFNIDEDKLPLG